MSRSSGRSADEREQERQRQRARRRNRPETRPCGDNTPSLPAGLLGTFSTEEKEREDRIRLRTECTPVTTTTSGSSVTIREYVAEIRSSGDRGATWSRPRRQKIQPKDDDDATNTIHADWFAIRKRRRYQWRWKAISTDGCDSGFSAWDPVSPGARPTDSTNPPRPKDVTIFNNGTDRVVLDWDDPVVYEDLSGTVSTTIGSPTVTGVGTAFLTELTEGDTIRIGAEDKRITAIASDTSLTAASNYAAANAGAVAYVEEVDPDVNFYRAEISTSSTFATVYKRSRRLVHTKWSVKVADADSGGTFYGRVWTVDHSKNRSRPIPGTLAGNNDPLAAASGVTIGKGAGKTKHTFSIRGRLKLLAETETHDQDIDEPMTLNKVRVRLKQAPLGLDVIVKVWKNNTTLAATITVTAGTKRGVADGLAVAFADADSVSISVDQIGSTYPGKHATIVCVFG